MAKSEKTFVARPLAGLPREAELVAMRDILPAATLTVALSGARGGGEAQLVTILPDLERAWRRADGVPVVALQPPRSSDDVSRDLGNALEAALVAEPGEPAEAPAYGSAGTRLQELLDLDAPGTFELAGNLDFWRELAPGREDIAEAADRFEEELIPTVQVGDLPGAFWSRMGSREYLRWSLGVEEDTLLDGLARLQAERKAGVVNGAKYAGAFRVLGLVIPVWDLPRGTEAEDLVEPAAEFKARLDQALADTSPLDAGQRRSRAGLVARSLTLR
jgi:hypothetical protein